jgi:hypothetical protein
MSLAEIQTLWVRGALSNLERLSIVSHQRNDHPVRLFSYEPIPNLPAGTIWEDARAILPEPAAFMHSPPAAHGRPGIFSNLFRYQLLLQRGGIWSGCDSVCLKPLTFAADMEHFFGTERLPNLDQAKPAVRAITGVFKAPAGSVVVARALEIAQAAAVDMVRWAGSGPGALHQAATEKGLAQFMLRPEIFCPVNWWDVPALITGLTQLPDAAYAVHFWDDVWQRNFLDKNATYDPLCLYERLKSHYLHD